MDHDGGVIGVVEGRCGAIERGSVEAPFGEAIVPYQLRKIGAGICRSLAGRVP